RIPAHGLHVDTHITGTVSKRANNIAQAGTDASERRVNNPHLNVSKMRAHRGHCRINCRANVSLKLPSHSAQVSFNARHSRVDNARPRGCQFSTHASYCRVKDTAGGK